MYIWKNEIVQNNKFPTKLKLADITTPIFKKIGKYFSRKL